MILRADKDPPSPPLKVKRETQITVEKKVKKQLAKYDLLGVPKCHIAAFNPLPSELESDLSNFFLS